MNQVLEGFQLASQQKRLWALQQAETIWTHCRVDIAGPLDPERLRNALRSVLEQHDIMRTSFQRLPGRKSVIQHIAETASFDWQLRQLPDAAALAAVLDAQADAANLSGPDGSHGSLLRAELFLAPGMAALVLRLPALCADMTTLQMLTRDLSQAYTQAPVADIDQVQYVQFSEWQNELLASDDDESASARAFWQAQSSTPKLSLPYEHPGAGAPRYAMRSWELPASLTVAVRACAQAEETSESAVLQAAWATVLAHASGQESFSVGVWSAGRVHEELANTYGPIDRFLPVTWNVAGGYTMPMLARRLESLAQAASEWHDFATFANATPAAGFAYHSVDSRFRAADCDFTLREPLALDEQFKLALICAAGGSALHCTLAWDTQVLAPDAVAMYPERLQTLLEQAMLHPQMPAVDLRWVGDAERTRVLQAFAAQSSPPPPFQGVHQWIERQAAATPDVVAIEYGTERWTYRDLDARANQLAHAIAARDIGREHVVGIAMPRSLEMIVALLAIWKAGAAYVPLDPGLPQQRLQAMLEDSQAALVLTQPDFAPQFAPLGCPMLALDPQWEQFTGESTAPLERPADPGQLAYVLFTSGSTGRPKGVAVEHRQLLNYVSSLVEQLAPAVGQRYGMISTFAADLGYTMILSALCTGGTLRIISQALSTDAEGLAAELSATPLEYLKIVPSHLRALLTSSRPEQILPQRCLVLGGESTTRDLVERVQALAPHCAILHHYGPTETTIGVLTHWVAAEHSWLTRTLPLSQPVQNTAILLLDEQAQPAPLGLPGEIYVAGAAVARGYVGQPGQSTAAFLADPYATTPEKRMYRTGDMARLWPDGTLEILGRRDDQIKYHGYRVELDELRHALATHPIVQDCVVSLVRSGDRPDRLAGYYVAATPIDPDELRSWMARTVIEEVIPTAFVRIDRLPLTPNGKIDRQALPQIDALQAQRTFYVAPRTSEERRLAEIWQDVLGLEQVGIHERFFALGGDSILGIQVVARANQAGLPLNPKQLFEHQTIAELAAVVPSQHRLPIDQGPVCGEAPLSPIQHWFFSQELARPAEWVVSVWLDLSPELGPAVLRQALEHILAHHDGLRTAFVGSAGDRRGMWDDAAPVLDWISVNCASLPTSDHSAAVEQALAEQRTRVDLAAGRVFQAAYASYGPSRPAQLIITAHRLIIDGLSWRIMLEHLAQACAQTTAGGPIQLPPKTSSFKAWAEQLNAYAHSERALADAAYWQTQAEAAAAVSVPLDLPRPTGSWRLDACVASRLTAEETHALRHTVPTAYQTEISDVLLTALAQSLSAWLGSATMAVDLEHHGREDIEDGLSLEQTIGWFTALYPITLRLPGADDPGTALKSIKEQLRTIPHHGISYGALRFMGSASMRERLTGSAPIHFRYAGQFTAPSTLPFTPIDQREPVVQTSQHMLAINTAIINDCLEISWWYSPELHQAATVERLAERYLASLRTLIAHCQQSDAGGFTPSDFSLLDMDQTSLDSLLKKLGSS